MYGKRRGGGRGFRNNNNFNGVASRVSPDGPARGGFNNSGYRNFGRGFGRGRGRFFESSQPLRKEDMFMEAGRLAAEYLVAKGMLPSNALPLKFTNGGFGKEVGESQEFRQQDGEYMKLESRTSALARLGSFEKGSDRKQYSNDYGTSGSKNNVKGERDKGSINNYDSDRGQENGKSGSISGRSRASSDKEADDDALSVHHDVQLSTKDDEQNVKVDEPAPKNNGIENLPSEAVAGTSQLLNEFAGKDVEHMSCMEGDKESNAIGNTKLEDEEMKESNNEEVTGQHSPIEDSIMQPSQVAATPSQKGNELLQQCNFAKVPTRIRSLRSKGSKGNDYTTIEKENISAGTSANVDVAKSIDRSLVNPLMEEPPLISEKTSTGTPVVTELLVDAAATVVGLSKSSAVFDQDLDLMTTKITPMDDSDPSFGKAILFDHDGSAEESKSLESLSFPVRSFSYAEETNRGQHDSNFLESLDEFVASERGGKRVLDESEGTFKKLKSWHPSMIDQVDEYPHLPNLSTERSTMIKKTSPNNNLMTIPNENSCRNLGFSALQNDHSVEYVEDKQMVDSSFKICDLNLMEGSHVDDSYNGSQMMFFPSMSGMNKDPLSGDVGLTIGDNSNSSRQYSTVGTHGKELQVINLDDDFADDIIFNPGEKREDTVYTGLESFPVQPRTSNDQDGYGLMISELLGNEIPNCSTVAGNINSLHNDMGLHDGQGMLPEDDPIYMTLGEIPISMSGFWEPPNPEFGKPF